mmetsp:Transcript_22082/g.51532  ORF Transcript_22082/g.51532 Transcript_22082/m.51532 type:complete len:219 (+) Transcript_22082:3274-3930(+)
MHPLALQSVEEGRQDGYQRFALAGAHLSNVPLVECYAAHKLNVEVPEAQNARRSLSNHGKSLRQQRVQAFTALSTPLEFSRELSQLVVALALEVRLQSVDFHNRRSKTLPCLLRGRFVEGIHLLGYVSKQMALCPFASPHPVSRPPRHQQQHCAQASSRPHSRERVTRAQRRRGNGSLQAANSQCCWAAWRSGCCVRQQRHIALLRSNIPVSSVVVAE